jgi:hypothetical protein
LERSRLTPHLPFQHFVLARLGSFTRVLAQALVSMRHPVRAQGIGARSGTLSVLFVTQVARRAPEYGLQGSALWRTSDPADTKIRGIGAAEHTAIRSRMRQTVRAQGIEGARSGRAKHKIHAKHGIFCLA